jgi:hypothetical protein
MILIVIMFVNPQWLYISIYIFATASQLGIIRLNTINLLMDSQRSERINFDYSSFEMWSQCARVEDAERSSRCAARPKSRTAKREAF